LLLLLLLWGKQAAVDEPINGDHRYSYRFWNL